MYFLKREKGALPGFGKNMFERYKIYDIEILRQEKSAGEEVKQAETKSEPKERMGKTMGKN